MKPVFIALDFPNAEKTFEFLKPFNGIKNLSVKIGMELFYREGPAIIKKLRNQNINIFLDLKLHDIPHTAEQAAFQLAQLDIQYTTIHALGGGKMIQAAKDGLKKGAEESNHEAPKLLAVTQLTSTSESQLQIEEQINHSMQESVAHLANIAYQSGADGVISSALEDKFIHEKVSDKLLCINPGIRLKNNSKDDQKRVVTPAKAHDLGSNGIVVGRSITQSDNPVETYKMIYSQINGGK
ncbi:orotidine-5'-phosphate decarboxylase [Apilactobacillus apisilvae]|uniref:Orotidine 5'-phosphate decarboxylase n=1 Tax=Apilactobacillus apisilvae TaxID=2923364 RepID=A0ABY4PG24_9LACO|nr:orotidine-5'-phosphate decarboxylase [Apilactobacillus apisilvae]UQS84755.1 orotidine-5'-phosphate decarboxylase [Apilactobacillus apisilvae]